MTFYALRLECPSCGHTFLVGGARGNDLTRWRQCEVDCPRCQERSKSSAGEMVRLDGRSPEASVSAV
jgi:hypothetical protein